jgi:hypothetical protein
MNTYRPGLLVAPGKVKTRKRTAAAEIKQPLKDYPNRVTLAAELSQ